MSYSTSLRTHHSGSGRSQVKHTTTEPLHSAVVFAPMVRVFWSAFENSRHDKQTTFSGKKYIGKIRVKVCVQL